MKKGGRAINPAPSTHTHLLTYATKNTTMFSFRSL